MTIRVAYTSLRLFNLLFQIFRCHDWSEIFITWQGFDYAQGYAIDKPAAI